MAVIKGLVRVNKNVDCRYCQTISIKSTQKIKNKVKLKAGIIALKKKRLVKKIKQETVMMIYLPIN